MDAAPPVDQIRVVYRDEHVVALDKPSGLLVHRTPEARDRVFLLQEAARLVGAHLFPIHRLDRATSGAILFGLTSAAARAFHDALKTPEARKEYLVLCRGSAPERFASDRPLTGKAARTEFTRLFEVHRASLLRARLLTGRRHQIRRHLAHLAHQVIGDTSYGKGRINRALREEYGLPRLALHAERIALPHPLTGEPLTVHVPLAADLRAFLLRLPGAPAAQIASL